MKTINTAYVFSVALAFFMLPTTLSAQKTAPSGNETTTSDDTQSPLVDDQNEQDCFPSCRTGYLCHHGKCINLCNPPCDNDEKCTLDGECAPRQTAAPKEPEEPSPPSLSTDTNLEIEPEDTPVFQQKIDEPTDLPRSVLRIGLGPTACVSAECKTFKRGDFGLNFGVSGGYFALPWLSIELALTLTPLFINLAESTTEDRNFWYATDVGAVFHPLGAGKKVSPAMGIFVGYLGRSSRGETNSGTKMENMIHALDLALSVGLNFQLTRTLSMGLDLGAHHPIYTTVCTELTNSSTSQTTDMGCSSASIEQPNFYFNLEVRAGVHF